MKVVRPDWLVESAEAGQLLPWQDYVFRPGERVEATQGKKVGQRSLFEGLASQAGASTARELIVPAKRLITTTAKDTQPVAGPSRIAAPPSPHTPPRTPSRKSEPMNMSTDSPPRPLHTTDPSTPSQAARVPGYAAHASNPAAQRAMADPAWRAAHTSAAPGFIEGYYRHSRLHHLSAWKAELRALVAEAQERAEDGRAEALGGGEDGVDGAVGRVVRENVGGRAKDGSAGESVSMRGAQLVMRSPGKGKGRQKEAEVEDKDRVIMHCDFDSFFVSAGLLDRPQLRGKPVVVCHSQGAQGGASSTSEIASASYEAREFGIRSGMRCDLALCSMQLHEV